MKVWTSPPAKREVEEEVRRFFSLLTRGKLEEARDAVAHAHDDWQSQLWSLWQDTYLISLEDDEDATLPADTSLEGEVWLARLDWLADLGIEERFHWRQREATVAAEGESFFVNVTYRGAVTDASAEFRLARRQGGLVLMREIIHVA